MKTKLKLLAALALLSTINHPLSTVSAQGTAFTYQGRLNNGTNAANGSYDLTFALFNVVSGAGQVGNTLTNSTTGVSNGLFTVTLDFGNQFPGQSRWLEIGVRTNGGGSFATLGPRQPLTPTPYAITAGNVVSGGITSGTYGNAVTFNNANNSFSGAFSGNGANVTNVNAATLNGLTSAGFWKTNGNTGADPVSGTFIGTTDNLPLEFKVNGTRALRLEPNASGAPNVIGGSPVNFMASGVVGATIGGGGATNYFGTSYTNSVASDFGAIGGGYFNQIQPNALGSTIGGGDFNQIQTDAFVSTIGGGEQNQIQPGAYYSTIGGGEQNQIQPNAYYSAIGGGGFNQIQGYADGSTIGGGEQNQIQPDALVSAIGGGEQNQIQPGAFGSTIGGGGFNQIQTDAYYSTIGGGYYNQIQTNAYYSTVGGGAGNQIQSYADGSTIGGGYYNTNSGAASVIPGGEYNLAAGRDSFAAGYYAQANHPGTFVWADNTSPTPFTSTANNQFLIRATGGVGIGTTSPQAALQVASSSIAPQLSLVQQLTNDYSKLIMGVVGFPQWTISVQPSPTPQLLFWNGSSNVAWLTYSGELNAQVFNPTSDRNAKENFQPVSPRAVLEKVTALPISQWNFKTAPGEEHIGPMAQDFHAAFGTGSDDKHIATVDADGVALAAIQGLNQKVEEKEAEIKELRQSVAELKKLLQTIVEKK